MSESKSIHDVELLSVAHRTVLEYPGGIDELAQAMGFRPTYLLKAVTGNKGAKLGLEDAEKLIRKSGDIRLLKSFASHFGFQTVKLPLPTLVSDDPRSQLQESIKSFGLCCLVEASIPNESARLSHLAKIINSFGSFCTEVSKRLEQDYVSLNDMQVIGQSYMSLLNELTESTLHKFALNELAQLISNTQATTDALALKIKPLPKL